MKIFRNLFNKSGEDDRLKNTIAHSVAQSSYSQASQADKDYVERIFATLDDEQKNNIAELLLKRERMRVLEKLFRRVLAQAMNVSPDQIKETKVQQMILKLDDTTLKQIVEQVQEDGEDVVVQEYAEMFSTGRVPL